MTSQKHIDLIFALELVAYEEAEGLLASGDGAKAIEFLRERIGDDERAETQAIQLGEVLAREARLFGGVDTPSSAEQEDDVIALKSQLECHLNTLARLAAAVAEDMLAAVGEVNHDL